VTGTNKIIRLTGEDISKKKQLFKNRFDATFRRMKENYMLNGQLKPGYNLQISTNEQIIVNYSLYQTTTDTTALKEHIKSFVESYNQVLEVLVADAGYDSEENYEMLERHKIQAYVKYNNFDREQKSKDTKMSLKQKTYITMRIMIVFTVQWDRR